MKGLPLSQSCGDCHIALQMTESAMVLLLLWPEDLHLYLPARMHILKKRILRGCRVQLQRAQVTEWPQGLRVTWARESLSEGAISAAEALFSRLATLYFEPITESAALQKLGLTKAAAERPSPDAIIKAARYGKRYVIPSYSLSEYLNLARQTA